MLIISACFTLSLRCPQFSRTPVPNRIYRALRGATPKYAFLEYKRLYMEELRFTHLLNLYLARLSSIQPPYMCHNVDWLTSSFQLN